MAYLKIRNKKYPIKDTVTIKGGTIFVDGEAIPRRYSDITIEGNVKNLFVENVQEIHLNGDVEYMTGNFGKLITK